MSSKRLETLADYARHSYRLRIECGCGRVTYADPHDMISACQRAKVSYRIEGLPRRLRCGACGQRPVRVGPGLGA